MDSREVAEASRPEPPHPCVRLVDGVPAQSFLEAPDRLKALEGVALERAVDVVGRDRNPGAALGRPLHQVAAGDAEALGRSRTRPSSRRR